MSFENNKNIEAPSAMEMAEFRGAIQVEKDKRRALVPEGSNYTLEHCSPSELTPKDYIIYRKMKLAILTPEEVNEYKREVVKDSSSYYFLDYVSQELPAILHLAETGEKLQ